MNRIIRKDGYCKLLLMPNKQQGLTEEYYVLVSSEDYPKVKHHDWRVYKQGNKLVAATRIGREFVLITQKLFPELKRVHRINDNSLDNRRFNIKHFRNMKNNNIVNQDKEQNSSLDPKKEENKILFKEILLDTMVYNDLERIRNELGYNSPNATIHDLIKKHDRMNEPVEAVSCEDCSCDKLSFWDKLRAVFSRSKLL